MKALLKTLPFMAAVAAAAILFFYVGVNDPYKITVAAIVAAVTTHYGLLLRHLKVSFEFNFIIAVGVGVDTYYNKIIVIIPLFVVEFDYFYLINRKK